MLTAGAGTGIDWGTSCEFSVEKSLELSFELVARAALLVCPIANLILD